MAGGAHASVALRFSPPAGLRATFGDGLIRLAAPLSHSQVAPHAFLADHPEVGIARQSRFELRKFCDRIVVFGVIADHDVGACPCRYIEKATGVGYV